MGQLERKLDGLHDEAGAAEAAAAVRKRRKWVLDRMAQRADHVATMQSKSAAPRPPEAEAQRQAVRRPVAPVWGADVQASGAAHDRPWHTLWPRHDPGDGIDVVQESEPESDDDDGSEELEDAPSEEAEAEEEEEVGPGDASSEDEEESVDRDVCAQGCSQGVDDKCEQVVAPEGPGVAGGDAEEPKASHAGTPNKAGQDETSGPRACAAAPADEACGHVHCAISV